MTPDVSVVIPAFSLQRWDDLVAAVTAVRGQTVSPREVIVVVDHNAELLDRVRATFPDIRAIANEQARGGNGSRNTAAGAAGGRVLAYLDDDACPEPRWLEAHLDAYADSRVLGTGGTVLPAWRGGRPVRLPPELWWIVGCTWTGTPEERAPIRNPIGGNMTIRADVLRAAGGFANALGRRNDRDGRVSGTADETELCIRAAAENPGDYFVHVPDAAVHHAVPAARTSWGYIASRSRVEGEAKAMLVGFVGAGTGLSSERRYVSRILPRAVLRELGAGLRGRPEGFERAAALVLSLSLTAWAYSRGRAATLRRGR
jgi:GT2 family glycosyltransferase